jgi:hypothetical protein
MSAERFFQISSGISSLIIVICIIFMIVGIFISPDVNLDELGYDMGEYEDYGEYYTE